MSSIDFTRFKIRPMHGLLIAWLCVLLIVCSPLNAFATVTQIEEYPGQMLYQSRQTLPDQNGNSWQVIAFKRIHPEGSAIVSLRLVGFPGTVDFDHTQPLTLITSTGQGLTATDISSEISQDTPVLVNVAEYDIRDVLPQLQAKILLQLTLPMVDASVVEIQIPAKVIQEWQTLSTSS